MQYFMLIIYIYLAIYTLYLAVLALRNLKDKPFDIEKRYSMFDEVKNNLAVIIYCHNNKAGLEELVNELKMQDYQLANFKVYAVLDNCNDGSEFMFENDRFVHVLNIQDVGTLGKTQAVSMLLEELKKDEEIYAYIFIDGNRRIESNFLTLANAAVNKNDAVTGEVNINRTNLDIIDKIKAVYKKYTANFIKRARTLCGLATTVDSGLFIVRKEVLDDFEKVGFDDRNSELEFSLRLTLIGHKCVYNPNIQSYIYGEDCLFKNPRLSKRFALIGENIKNLRFSNLAFAEQLFSLLNPNFWLILVLYLLLLNFSFNYVFSIKCKTVIFSAVLLCAVFALSFVNTKMSKKEVLLLMFHPIYSICHIIKNFPPIRYVLNKIGASADKEVDKLVIEVPVITKSGERPCKLEFISTESGLSKIRFINHKNKKYTTEPQLRMIDALQQLKSKMKDYGLTLKICSCCSKFTSKVDGSTNMLKGECHNEYPSPLLSEPAQTLIWNSCSCFEPAQINSFIEELAKEVENQQD